MWYSLVSCIILCCFIVFLHIKIPYSFWIFRLKRGFSFYLLRLLIFVLLSLIFFILDLVPPTEWSCFNERSCAERYCCKHRFFSFRFCCVFVFVLSLYSVYHIDYNRSTTDFFIFLILCFSCLFLFFDYSIAHTLQQKYNTEQLFRNIFSHRKMPVLRRF